LKLNEWFFYVGIALFAIWVGWYLFAKAMPSGDNASTFTHLGHRYIQFGSGQYSSVVHDPECPYELGDRLP
jgi:hypothetical protein